MSRGLLSFAGPVGLFRVWLVGYRVQRWLQGVPARRPWYAERYE